MSNQQTTVVNISWEEVGLLVDSLLAKLDLTQKKQVTGIPRGGIIPAVLISHSAGIPYIPYNQFESMSKDQKQKVLIIDDISDSGVTAQPLVDEGYTVATLCNKETCPIQVSAFGRNTGHAEWIQFPWESKHAKHVAGYLDVEKKRVSN